MEGLPIVSAPSLLTLLVKGLAVVVVVHYLAAQFQQSPASVRHRCWLALLLTLAALVLWTWQAPELAIPLLPAALPGIADDVSTALILAYLLVTLGRLAGLVASIIQVGLVTLRAGAAPLAWQRSLAALNPPRRILLKSTPRIASPVTWGYLRPVVLLPAEVKVSALERQMILLHELKHIERRDWLLQLLGQVICILFWPVPGMRAATKQLSMEAELACDDFVLEQLGRAPDYASLLLKQARARQLTATVALGRPSELAQRIRSLCLTTIDHRATAQGSHWLLPLCVLLALPLAALRLEPRVPQTAPLLLELSGVRLDTAPAVGMPPALAEILRPPRPTPVDAPPLAASSGGPELEFTTPRPAAVPGDWQPEITDLNSAVRSAVSIAVTASFAPPRYPRHALRRQLEGDVVARYDLLADGRITNIRIVESHPRGVFDRSVLTALAASGHSGGGEVVARDLNSVFRFRLTDARARASPD